MKIFLSSFLLTFFWTSAMSQAIVYVDSSNIGMANGNSWATAYPDLQDALETVQPGQQIWVAKGTYTPSKDMSGSVPLDLKNSTFKLRQEVKIYGGFAGTETNPNQRNWRKNKSILSGFHGLKYSRVVVRGDTIDSTACLDGFYITKAKGGNALIMGGGIFLSYSNLILRNLVVFENEAYSGGGIGMKYSSPYMVNLQIFDNTLNSSFGEGGAGVFIERGFPILINCQITKNKSPHIAGGMSCVNSSPTIYNATISGNITPYPPGNALSSGVMYNTSLPSFAASKPVFYNSILEGGIFNSINSVPSFTNCIGVKKKLFGVDTIPGIDGGGNLDTSVFYTDSANGNYIPAHCSPNIDAGDNQYLPKDFLDLDDDGDTTELLPIDHFGGSRLQNGTVDIGAFEGASSSDTVEAELCYGDTLSVAGNLITTQGVSLLSFPRAGLCDSLVYYDVKSPIDPQITVDPISKTLTASIANATYQWYDCTNGFALPGDTNQIFSPWVPSSYSVIITENGCTDTSECVNVVQVSLKELESNFRVNVFPNPSGGLYNLQFSEGAMELEIQILDLSGKVVLEKQLSSDDKYVLDITTKPAGIYVLKIFNSLDLRTYRLIKD